MQKVLEDANIKLASVATAVMGRSGRAMLAALVAGEEDSHVLANMALRKLRRKKAELELALEGRMGAHQRFLLALQLRHIDELDALIEQVSAEIEERLRPLVAELERLVTHSRHRSANRRNVPQ